MSLPCKRPGSPSSSPLMQQPDLYPLSEFTEPPDIPPHLTLETFNHKSTMNDEIAGSDKTNERLTMLGERLLEFVAMQSVFNRRIPVPAGKMSDECEALLAHERIDSWVKHYQLRENLRYHKGSVNVHSPEETRALFAAYVGALISSSSHNVVVDWLNRLIDPDILQPLRERERDSTHRYDAYSPSQRRVVKRSRDKSSTPTSQSDQMQMSPPTLPATPDSGSLSITTPSLFGAGVLYPYPPQPQSVPPPIPQSPVANSVQQTFLQAFNIRCAQNHLHLDYQAEFSGPPHAGRWSVSCVVNGVVKGHGQGSSKQLAKEEAAKQAYYQMGWGVTPS